VQPSRSPELIEEIAAMVGVGIGDAAQVIKHDPSSAQKSTRALRGEQGYFAGNRLSSRTRGKKNRCLPVFPSAASTYFSSSSAMKESNYWHSKNPSILLSQQMVSEIVYLGQISKYRCIYYESPTLSNVTDSMT